MTPTRPEEPKPLAHSAAVADSQSSKTFNSQGSALTDVCNKRNDILAHDVLNRLQNSIDLHAADCQLQLDCLKK